MFSETGLRKLEDEYTRRTITRDGIKKSHEYFAKN